MRFCIAPVSFWDSVGFDTTHWRRSVDGELAMCHDKFASALLDNPSKHDSVQTLSVDSEEFDQLIQERFTEANEEDPEFDEVDFGEEIEEQEEAEIVTEENNEEEWTD